MNKIIFYGKNVTKCYLSILRKEQKMKLKIIVSVILFLNSIFLFTNTFIISLISKAIRVSSNEKEFNKFADKSLKGVENYLSNKNMICKTLMDFGLILLYCQNPNYLRTIIVFGLFSLIFNLYYSPKNIKKSMSKKSIVIFTTFFYMYCITNIISMIFLWNKIF